jgi:hypothetical protein
LVFGCWEGRGRGRGRGRGGMGKILKERGDVVMNVWEMGG